MDLRHAALVYVFVETGALDRQRKVFETDVGLPIIEADPRPTARRGVVKYDAGTMLYSINVVPAGRRRSADAAGLVTILDVDPARPQRPSSVTDDDGRRYVFRRRAWASDRCQDPPTVAELRTQTGALGTAVGFYRDVLGLRLHSVNAFEARFAAGALSLVLVRPDRARGSRAAGRSSLLVFHTPDIERSWSALTNRGAAFKGRGIGSREFGYTAHFEDPFGQRLCLYEPSVEALACDTGRRISQIVRAGDGTLPSVTGG